jgi:hypothetical protein
MPVHDSRDPSSPDFGQRIETYVNDFVCGRENRQEAFRAEDQATNTQEQCEQMFFSSLAIMFKVLKTLRMQDSIG